MTALDTSVLDTLTTGAGELLVLGEALDHAVRRDLERLDRVLAEPVTAVRRDALIRHTTFVLDQIDEHFQLRDDALWPAAVAARPELADHWESLRRSRDDLAPTLAALRCALAQWRTAPAERAAVGAAIRAVAMAVRPVLDQDRDLLPVLCAAVGRVPTQPIAGRMVPTRRARRIFWLLDELDPARTQLLLSGTRRTTMWILRNGFSGAYNRSTYLMWEGGGTGPAV